jgi:hypothetical protein
MSAFGHLHFHALYEIVHGASPYLSTHSPAQLISALEADTASAIDLTKLVLRFPPSSDRITSLLTGPFLSRLRGLRVRARFQPAIIAEYPLYLQFVLNALSLFADLGAFAGVPVAMDDFTSRAQKSRMTFETALNVQLTIVNPGPVDLTRLLPQAVERVLRARSEALAATDERLMALRFQNHTCTVCRYRPAIYVAEPCMHPCVCQGCMQRLRELGSAMTHCYTCRTKLTRVLPLSYLTV